MYYNAKIHKEEGVYIVSFLDFPSIMTYGDTIHEALEHAYDALNGSLEVMFEKGFRIPEPTEKKGKDMYQITVEPRIALAFELRKLRSQKTQKEIAKSLGISYQAYQKLENPRKSNPTIRTLEKISNAFHKHLSIRFA